MKLKETSILFTDGNWIESKDQSTHEIRLLQTGNIGKGVFLNKNTRAKYISAETFKRLKCTEVLPGDLIISRLPDPIGRACIVPNIGQRMVTAVDCTIYRVNPKLVNQEYANYFLMSNLYFHQIISNVKGTTRKRISRKNLGNIKFPIPSEITQNDIVKKLSLIQKLISTYDKELINLDKLIKARFVEMFGDPINNTKYSYKKVSEIVSVLSGGTPKRDVKEYWKNGTVPWIKTTELKNNRIRVAQEHITKLGVENSSAKLVPKHTILIAMYGQGKTRGMTAYLEIPATTNQACACLLPSNKINSAYFWNYLIMSYKALRNLAKGGNQPNLNVSLIKNFKVLVPPLSLQNEFAAFVQQVDKSKVVNNRVMKYIINREYIIIKKQVAL